MAEQLWEWRWQELVVSSMYHGWDESTWFPVLQVLGPRFWLQRVSLIAPAGVTCSPVGLQEGRALWPSGLDCMWWDRCKSLQKKTGVLSNPNSCFLLDAGYTKDPGIFWSTIREYCLWRGTLLGALFHGMHKVSGFVLLLGLKPAHSHQISFCCCLLCLWETNAI